MRYRPAGTTTEYLPSPPVAPLFTAEQQWAAVSKSRGLMPWSADPAAASVT
jgi:hypothetical protein